MDVHDTFILNLIPFSIDYKIVMPDGGQSTEATPDRIPGTCFA
jgi:hypothetical protein